MFGSLSWIRSTALLSCATLALTASVASAQFGAVNEGNAKAQDKMLVAQAAPAPQPQPQVVKSETIPFGNWVVTCYDFTNSPVKHACAAKLQIVQEKTNAPVFIWEIGRSNDRKLVAIMHFPTGVMIEPGATLTIGKATPRKLAFTACAPAECTVQFPIEPAFVKDAAANKSIEAKTVAMNGTTTTFTINTAGLDKAFEKIAE